jgi:hypothetical protein
MLLHKGLRMENLCTDITAIVVGGTKQTLVAEAVACLNRINIPYELCEDIYSAVAMISAASAGGNLLVIGSFTALTTENMRLFSLAPKGRKVSFCCILKNWSGHFQPKAMTAAQAGVFIINDAEHIEHIIKQCGTVETVTKPKTGGRDFASRITSLADKFFLTQAEQDALLGVNNNAAAENNTVTK